MDNKLTRNSIIRIVVFGLMLLWFVYLAAGYSYDYYNLSVERALIDVNDIGDVSIDGSDFTGMFKLMGLGFNGFMTSFLYIFIGGFILVSSLILNLIISLIAIRKDSVVTDKEYKLSLGLLIGAIALGLVIDIVLTRFSVLVSFIVFTAAWVLPTLLIYMLRLRGKVPKPEAQET
ncbi:MAG: hypothetical protein IJ757_08075 [Clostridiales bacterium]|nr:hypothetical protein [Clostridiales bacterium]